MLRTPVANPESNPTIEAPFFDGFLLRPDVAASGLVAVGAVARTRYFEPTTVPVADPVVSSDGTALRFESFSVCGGVYARLDVLPEGLKTESLEVGVTNIDLNEPLRRSLAGLGDGALMHLRIGPGGLGATTDDGGFVEHKVDLPQRWIRGFAEVSVVASHFGVLAELSPSEAASLLGRLTQNVRASGTTWLSPNDAGLRRLSRPVPGAISLAGAQRLEWLRPLLRHIQALRVYGPSVTGDSLPASSGWELQLPDARLTLVLSPEVRRGFSGEGAALRALMQEHAGDDAEMIEPLLASEPQLDVRALACRLSLEEHRMAGALAWLGASGLVGFDLATGRHFHRPLPFSSEDVVTDNPRFRGARMIVDDGCVELDADPTKPAKVAVGDRVYLLRRRDGSLRCTCPWFAAYGSSRGPCRHALAVEIAERQATSA